MPRSLLKHLLFITLAFALLWVSHEHQTSMLALEEKHYRMAKRKKQKHPAKKQIQIEVSFVNEEAPVFERRFLRP